MMRGAARHGLLSRAWGGVGRPCLRAMDAGLTPEYGEWGREGRTYVLADAVDRHPRT